VTILADKHCDKIMQEIADGYFYQQTFRDKVEVRCLECGKGKIQGEEAEFLKKLS
jgi:hypothetical protein